MKKYFTNDYREIPLAGVIEEAGTAEQYQTGTWGTFRPVFNAEICIQCLFCWIYCPDSAILVQEGQVVGIDYDHCKGCAICSHECPTKPVKAILMEKKAL